ncbi:tail fiber domain-containing protein [Pedobacter punctiformis]|uniref:Tail fiber domain-containing protein n=1 Tax=Pedobacter punctiformis TaxID=3004097 RepID=A0ABT4LB87_9SPHI|nr:tail fiber domain-containing protein [Pedobacter sp. HCMS5-2]MCZ4245164.1 tail fiber domain-containing protein [Pedobacter sp. HCMS5-2]
MKRAISFCFAVFLTSASLKINAQEIVQNNVQPINNSVTLVSQLEPVSFNYEKQWAEKLKLSSKPQYGFIPASVQKVLPALVSQRAKDYSSGKNAFKTATIPTVDYQSLIPLLVGSIKEQQKQIEELKREIEILKTQKSK